MGKSKKEKCVGSSVDSLTAFAAFGVDLLRIAFSAYLLTEVPGDIRYR